MAFHRCSDKPRQLCQRQAGFVALIVIASNIRVLVLVFVVVVVVVASCFFCCCSFVLVPVLSLVLAVLLWLTSFPKLFLERVIINSIL